MRDVRTRGGPLLPLLIVAAVVAAPGLLFAWSTIGGMLGVATNGNGWQRDVRIFNNSNDAAANNNVIPEAAYPGALGAPLAIWKAAKGWASDNVLAARNFDYDWQGIIPTLEGNNDNIVSWDAAACSGGVLAYTELPLDDGWNIVMCDNWTWSDGPGALAGGQVDIQGVATHELGHALGLGHSTVNCGGCTLSATMCAAICSNGVSERSIAPDDQAGLQAVYGTIPATKPTITGLAGSVTTLQTLIINGTNFPAMVHVKFTAKTSVSIGNNIPGVVYNVATTSATQVSVTIPYYADDGNVIVWNTAGGVISNAFPIDINYITPPPPPPPVITSLSTTSVTAFAGGSVTINGSGFTGATQVHVGAITLTLPFGFTVGSDTAITFGAPVPPALGPYSVTVTAPGGSSNAVTLTYNETLPPKLTCPGSAISNVNFNWSCGAGLNDVLFLIASTDPTTFDFGTPYQILLNFQIIGQGVATGSLGTGSFSLTIPAGLAGVTFYSQIGAVDEVTFAISASNITATTILF